MSRLVFIFVFYLVFILLDLYVFRGLRLSFPMQERPVLKVVLQVLYWTVPAFLTFMLLKFFVVGAEKPSTAWILAFMGLFILFYVPKLILVAFNGISDLIKVSEWIWFKTLGDKTTSD